MIPANGVAWRAGVGEPTIVTLSTGSLFAGRQVNPGTYSLIAKVYGGEWVVYLNKVTSNTEAFDFDKIKDQNILEGSALISKSDKNVDVYTMELNTEGILISYGKNRVQISVRPW